MTTKQILQEMKEEDNIKNPSYEEPIKEKLSLIEEIKNIKFEIKEGYFKTFDYLKLSERLRKEKPFNYKKLKSEITFKGDVLDNLNLFINIKKEGDILFISKVYKNSHYWFTLYYRDKKTNWIINKTFSFYTQKSLKFILNEFDKKGIKEFSDEQIKEELKTK